MAKGSGAGGPQVRVLSLWLGPPEASVKDLKDPEERSSNPVSLSLSLIWPWLNERVKIAAPPLYSCQDLSEDGGGL